VMRLHLLHFAEKKGSSALDELAEEKLKAGLKEDARKAREHRQRLQALKDSMDHRIKNALMNGSMSVWTKEERDKIEEARQDPEEALARMKGHMKDLGRSYKEEKSAMAERVAATPAMNVRPKEDWELIEHHRQDPQEARERMAAHMKERSETYRAQRQAQTERVRAIPNESVRTKEERARYELARQDPEEAMAEMVVRKQDMERKWRQEKMAMTARVEGKPPMTFWSKEEHERNEALRQDPAEAREHMTQYMNQMRQSDREAMASMKARVAASPRKTFWPKDQKEQIETARRDPEEAKEKAKLDMKALAESYRERKKEMRERVEAIPRKTFFSPEDLQRRRRVEELRVEQQRKLARTDVCT